MRKLSEYYHFNIEVKEHTYPNGNSNVWVSFTKANGEPMESWRAKLTPSQWKKAEKYLTRKLVPFCGYRYEVKVGVKVGTYKVI